MYVTFDDDEIRRIDAENAKETARDKVIEAAKAWWADIKAGDYYYPVDSIGKAVKALQEVEGCETGTTPTR